MSKRALKALKSSIRHWRRLATGKVREGERVGWHWCSLCRLYNSRLLPSSDCTGCPVYARTGARYCEGTPYDQTMRSSHNYPDYLQHPRFLEAAAEELKFLESLLPKGEKVS